MGLRLLECLRLRVKDVDFDRKVVIVREGKGGKDRVVMLPQMLIEPLRSQLATSRALWAEDRAADRAGVWLPDAIDRKFLRAAASWTWHWVFPSAVLSKDPRAAVRRRHHRYEQSVGRAIGQASDRARIEKKVTLHTLRHSSPEPTSKLLRDPISRLGGARNPHLLRINSGVLRSSKRDLRPLMTF
jgi:integrase